MVEMVDQLRREARRTGVLFSRGTAVVYFLRLRSGVIYCGVSLDLDQRLYDHGVGRACRTTAIDPPVGLLRLEWFGTFKEARAREAQLKGWSRAKKEALVRGDVAALKRLSRSRDT